MDHSKRIDTINAYRSLEGLPLKIKSKDDSIKQQIQKEFEEWVKGRILDLLNAGEKDKAAEKQPAFHPALATLNPMQIEALASLANQVLSKKGVQTQVKQTQSPLPQGRIQEGDADTMSKFNNQVLKQISDLEKMEREAPEY